MPMKLNQTVMGLDPQQADEWTEALDKWWKPRVWMGLCAFWTGSPRGTSVRRRPAHREWRQICKLSRHEDKRSHDPRNRSDRRHTSGTWRRNWLSAIGPSEQGSAERGRMGAVCGWRSQFDPDCPGSAWKAACSRGTGGIGGVMRRMSAQKPMPGPQPPRPMPRPGEPIPLPGEPVPPDTPPTPLPPHPPQPSPEPVMWHPRAYTLIRSSFESRS
jgi:hypothetical protein